MNFMIFILAFVMAVDENTCTRVLHRPLVACTLFGMLLGNAPAAMAAGAVLEMSAIAFDIARPSNYILASLAAALLAVNGSDAATASIMAAGLFFAGLMLKSAVSLLSTVMLPGARKAAEKRDEKGLFAGVLVSVLLYGIVFGAAAMWMASFGEEAAQSVADLLETNGWILSAVHTAALLISAIGIAVLFRNLSGNRIPGAFMGGFTMAAVLCAIGLDSAAAILCGMVAFAIGAFDYHLRAVSNDKPAETKEIKKGGAQWW